MSDTADAEESPQAKRARERADRRAAEAAEQLAKRTDQRERALVWMRHRFPETKPCPECDANQWSVTEPVALYPLEGGALGSTVYPVVQVICGNCGFTKLFNAPTAGMMEALGLNADGDDADPADES